MKKKSNNKNKLKLISLVVFIILLISLLIYLIYPSNTKFYLEDKYYQEGIMKDITLEELNELIDSKENFILFTYNNYCNLQIPCSEIFEEAAINNNLTIYSIKYEYFKESTYHKIVKFAPSVLLINNGDIISYLDSESDSDLNKYQDVNEFTNWLSEYIYLVK